MHCRIEKSMWENHIFISCAKIVTIPAYSRAKMNTNVFLILYPFLWYQIWLHVFAPFLVRTNFPTSYSPFYLLKSHILSDSALYAYPRYIRYAGRQKCIKRQKNGRERRREGKTAKGKDRCHRVTLDTGQWPWIAVTIDVLTLVKDPTTQDSHGDTADSDSDSEWIYYKRVVLNTGIDLITTECDITEIIMFSVIVTFSF